MHEAVAKKLGISAEEAQGLRRRLAEHAVDASAQQPGDRRDPVRQAVYDATRTLIAELCHEVSLCLRYYAVTFRGHRPSRLRLLGGEAVDPQLQEMLSAALSLTVETAKPLASVKTDGMNAADLVGGGAQWGLAMGLALRRINQYFGARDGKPRQARGLRTGESGPRVGPEVTTLSPGDAAPASADNAVSEPGSVTLEAVHA